MPPSQQAVTDLVESFLLPQPPLALPQKSKDLIRQLVLARSAECRELGLKLSDWKPIDQALRELEQGWEKGRVRLEENSGEVILAEVSVGRKRKRSDDGMDEDTPPNGASELTSLDALCSLLQRGTARSRLLAERFHSPKGWAFEPLCPHITKLACAKSRQALTGTFSACSLVHFRPILRPHTDPSLGHCSYLNTCYSEPSYALSPSIGPPLHGRECLRVWGYTRVDEIVWVKTNQLQRVIRTGRTGHWLKCVVCSFLNLSSALLAFVCLSIIHWFNSAHDKPRTPKLGRPVVIPFLSKSRNPRPGRKLDPSLGRKADYHRSLGWAVFVRLDLI